MPFGISMIIVKGCIVSKKAGEQIRMDIMGLNQRSRDNGPLE